MSQIRQLAALMFTDIVGYSALMGQDERKALEVLTKNRAMQKPVIEQYNGRYIKELGDGVMASFNTVSDAVNAAIEIQRKCHTSNEFRLRIGIHVGEVVFENSDVFGDGVNVAARIQALAEPGTVWISEAVHNNISNKHGIKTKFVSVEHLKNIKEPIRIYQVLVDGDESPPLPGTSARNRASGKNIFYKHRKSVILSIGTLLILASGYTLYTVFQNASMTALRIEETADRSIAVLPFVNMSSDKDQEYFSDGLSEELLNLLAKIPQLKVIGRTSSFSFKGKNEDLREIAEKLGVAHLLEGSVRKDGNKIRVTAQLIKAKDGSHIWSETYDRDLKEIFKLQDEIAKAVVLQLKLKLLKETTPTTGNVESYNLILQGNYFYDRQDKENVAKSVDFYNQAIAVDSGNARAWGKLARAYSRQAWLNYVPRNLGRDKARKAALRAIELNPALPDGYVQLGAQKLYQDFDWHGAEELYQKAMNLEPDNVDILTRVGDGLYFVTGRWIEAVAVMKRILELDPLTPLSYLGMGNVLTHAGRPEEAIAYFLKTLELNPQFPRAHMYLGRNYLMLGKTELALEVMQQENSQAFKAFGLALATHALGRRIESDEKAKAFIDTYQNEWPYLVAELHAYRGEKDKALAWLEIAYSKRDGWLTFLKGDPLLKNLQGDDRFNGFMEKMNLPPD